MARDKKTKRIDTSPDAKPLTDNPFAALSAAGLPEGSPSVPTPPEQECPASRYRVGKTAKGGFHVSIEKRAAGKTVTIIHNVEGDGETLARDLKKHCGTGGTFTGSTVELQGDVREKVGTLLRKWVG